MPPKPSNPLTPQQIHALQTRIREIPTPQPEAVDFRSMKAREILRLPFEAIMRTQINDEDFLPLPATPITAAPLPKDDWQAELQHLEDTSDSSAEDEAWRRDMRRVERGEYPGPESEGESRDDIYKDVALSREGEALLYTGDKVGLSIDGEVVEEDGAKMHEED